MTVSLTARVSSMLMVLALIIGGLGNLTLPRTGTAAAPDLLNQPFPRIGTIYSKTDINTCAGKEAIAKFNLFVTDIDWWPDRNFSPCVPPGSTFGQYVKSLNPSMITLLYAHATMFKDGDWAWRPGTTGYMIDGKTYYVDLRWFLTYAGSTLAAPIDANSTAIPVADLAMYEVDDRAIIGGLDGQSWPEMVRIVGKSAENGPGTLTVVRGINAQNGKFPAATHNQGDAVRSVAHAFRLPYYMLMNVTPDAKRTNINPQLGNQNWNEFLTSYLPIKLSEPEFSGIDGIFLDNLVDYAIELVDKFDRVDIYNTNTPTGFQPFDEEPKRFYNGVRDITERLRARIPADKVIVGNTGGSADHQGAVVNGGMIEGIYPDGTNPFVGDVMAFYKDWMTKGRPPAMFIFNAGSNKPTDEEIRTDYKAMRFLLTLSMVYDGHFVYDEVARSIVPYQHQSSWWYDEYDNAGERTGYLGYPLGAATQPIAGVYRREFTNGVSIANTTNVAQVVPLGKPYRKILGRQAPDVNDGQVVSSVTLQPKDGIILLRADYTPQPTRTAEPTKTATATPGSRPAIVNVPSSLVAASLPN